jgi:general secretion pathway protein G
MKELGVWSGELGAERGCPAFQCCRVSVGISSGCLGVSARHWPLPTRRSVRRAGAFTLIELLATVAIIAIVAGLTLGTLGYVNKKGAEGRARAEVAALSAAIDSYKLDFGSYPASQAVLFRELTGHTSANNKSKVYIEPTPGMLVTNAGVVRFADPWGAFYGYRNPGTDNVGFFDLWSTAGNAAATNAPNWIRN